MASAECGARLFSSRGVSDRNHISCRGVVSELEDLLNGSSGPLYLKNHLGARFEALNVRHNPLADGPKFYPRLPLRHTKHMRNKALIVEDSVFELNYRSERVF